MFEELISTYQTMEPAGTDTWNPVVNELELWHRVRLLIELVNAVKSLQQPPQALRVLDVGCGNGRSTRLLLELGIRPERILGIDLRSSAIEHAHRLNPAIAFREVRSFEEWPEGSFDLCLQCTAFSSISGAEPRAATARMMEKAVGERGAIFWWDRTRANDFAGNDLLDPKTFFPGRRLSSLRQVSLWPSLSESLRPLRGFRSLLAQLLGSLEYPQTHVAALFGPKL